ncbi:hypothetical protein GCM10010345_12990 [Streptomyces canarius]|uniref:Uncharacterized protein n=1 Tax=Streptomyces canarius TaxID=285453 RepID=A0ABQ3CFB1_9ACTN|nr:hypothetical protein GCM10010345_12990 [Streptomyces canarius]
MPGVDPALGVPSAIALTGAPYVHHGTTVAGPGTQDPPWGKGPPTPTVPTRRPRGSRRGRAPGGDRAVKYNPGGARARPDKAVLSPCPNPNPTTAIPQPTTSISTPRP